MKVRLILQVIDICSPNSTDQGLCGGAEEKYFYGFDKRSVIQENQQFHACVMSGNEQIPLRHSCYKILIISLFFPLYLYWLGVCISGFNKTLQLI